MTLWNLIRDFFVFNVFGGTASNGALQTNIVGTFTNENFVYEDIDSGNLFVTIGKVISGNNDALYTYISFGDWLSTTFTIITLVLLVMFLYIFVKWIFKLFSGLLH